MQTCCFRFYFLWVAVIILTGMVCFLKWMAEVHGSTCPMNCTSRAIKFKFSTSPCLFHTSSTYVGKNFKDGSGFETPTHNVESENTRTFILVNVAAGSLSNVILDHRNVSSLARFVRVCAIDQRFSLVVVKTVSNLAPLKTLIIRHPFEIIVILCKPSWSPETVARELVPDLKVEREILNIGRIFAKCCTYTVQYLIVKFVLLLIRRVEILCRIVELPDLISFHQYLIEDQLSFHRCLTDLQ